MAITYTPTVRHDDVYFDCYTWLSEIRKRGGIPITGIFRTAQILNRHFRPAYVWDGEDLSKKFGDYEVLRLGAYLGQAIHVLRPHTMQKEARGFISLGVEQTPPRLSEKVKYRIAILHDCMAARSVFGSLSRTRFSAGIGQNNVLLYVSESTRLDYDRLLKQDRSLIALRQQKLLPFPQCHHLTELPLEDDQLKTVSSLSVHSLFPYKNMERLAEVIKAFPARHTHIGQNHLTCLQTEEWNRLRKKHKITWNQNCSDADLVKAYRDTPYFFCLSRSEGFSLPPMEAILNGASFVVLSAIPAHLEVYGQYSVNFVSPEVGDYIPDNLKAITDNDRFRLFQQRTPAKMMAELLNLPLRPRRSSNALND